MACSRCGKSRNTNPTPSGIRKGTARATGESVKKSSGDKARDAISGMKYVPGK